MTEDGKEFSLTFQREARELVVARYKAFRIVLRCSVGCRHLDNNRNETKCLPNSGIREYIPSEFPSSLAFKR
jgi:hypothetical protein